MTWRNKKKFRLKPAIPCALESYPTLPYPTAAHSQGTPMSVGYMQEGYKFPPGRRLKGAPAKLSSLLFAGLPQQL